MMFLRRVFPLLILIVVLDIFFLYSFGKVYFTEFQVLSLDLQKLNVLLQSGLGEMVSANDASNVALDVAAFDAIVRSIYFNIARVLGFLFLFWTAFQGSVWYFCHRIVGKARALPDFFWRFALVSIVAFLIFLLILSGAMLLAFKSASDPLPLIGRTGISLLAAIAMLILYYFVMVAYSVLCHGAFWKRFTHASIYHMAKNGISYVGMLLSLGVCYIIASWLAKSDYILVAMSFVLFVLLPVVAFWRVYFVSSINVE